MEKSEDNNRHQAVLSIVIGFVASSLIFAISAVVQSDEVSLFFEKASVALYIFACTVQGLKLTEENKTMPSAGFTMMAISQGVIFGSYFEGANEGYDLFTAGMFLFLPAMFLIAFHKAFPVWLKILGILCCVPFMIDFVIFEQQHHYIPVLDTIYTIAEIVLHVTALCWAYFVWKNYQVVKDLPREE